VLILTLLGIGLVSFAQETATVVDRPAENELLLNTTPDDPAVLQVPEDGGMPGVGFGDFLRVIIVLLIVIALIYAFVWLLKKFTGTKAVGADVIKLYSTQPLKGDTSLHLVEVGKSIYLIGSSGNSVNLISEINDKESIDEIRLNASLEPSRAVGGFARLIKDKITSSVTNPDEEMKNAQVSTSFLRKQRERLKDL